MGVFVSATLQIFFVAGELAELTDHGFSGRKPGAKQGRALFHVWVSGFFWDAEGLGVVLGAVHFLLFFVFFVCADSIRGSA
jgi:hypothetical protein